MIWQSSRPFSNGSEYAHFFDYFCDRCKKLKYDNDGFPLPDNCMIEDAMQKTMFDESAWPKEYIVENSKYHICLHFESEDRTLMRQYHDLFIED